jgi:lipopolysaccharide/colanic/teichoic acid biosynthesis glycosyltransferase
MTWRDGAGEPSTVFAPPPTAPWERTDLPAPSGRRRASRYERWVKPVMDRALATVLLLLVSPVLGLCALAVLLTLGRPVMFRQRRVGLHGTEFQMLKFRTMTPDRRAGLDRRGAPRPGVTDRRQVHKHPRDPRLTSLGRFLRTWSLDELPQLWHVVTGHMSLVGPRPEMVEIVQRYTPWQHRRHLVKPGLTGLWQITERNNGQLMHEHVDVDLAYVERISFWADLRILLRTLPAAVGLSRGS